MRFIILSSLLIVTAGRTEAADGRPRRRELPYRSCLDEVADGNRQDKIHQG